MDAVNALFRRSYPADHETAWEIQSCGSGSYGRRYTGAAGRDGAFFPCIVCADGFIMSVQGHFGAYSTPRDDFAEEYRAVEVLCPREELFEAARRGEPSGDERLYPYVPISIVLAVIEKHGGLAPVVS